MSEQNQIPQMVQCPLPMLNKIVKTLQTMPYNQVAVLLDEIKVNFGVVMPCPVCAKAALDNLDKTEDKAESHD